eukprot:11272053-Ditylum_brightwellii.AAC.1
MGVLWALYGIMATHSHTLSGLNQMKPQKNADATDKKERSQYDDVTFKKNSNLLSKAETAKLKKKQPC